MIRIRYDSDRWFHALPFGPNLHTRTDELYLSAFESVLLRKIIAEDRGQGSNWHSTAHDVCVMKILSLFLCGRCMNPELLPMDTLSTNENATC